MATRVHIAAAAACLVMAGTLVGGTGMVLAFADPGTGQSSDAGGAATDPADGGTSQSPAGQTSAGAPTSGATPAAAATVTAPKPTSEVGDGRGGMPLDGAGTTPNPVTSSKQSAPSRTATPQTKAAPTTAAGPTSELLPAPGATDQPIDEKLPPTDDPTDPDDPEEHPGWQWWPWCWPTPPGPGLPPGNGSSSGSGNGGGGGVGIGKPPIGVGVPKPPPLPVISVDPTAGVIGGLATAATALPFVPLTVPAIVPPMGAGAGASGGGAGGPGVVTRPGGSPPVREPLPRAQEQSPPAFSASNGAMPASYRAGYGEYLRTAGVGDMAAVAVPGVTGILALTFVGGLLGFRQARAGHAVRASGTARFMG